MQTINIISINIYYLVLYYEVVIPTLDIRVFYIKRMKFLTENGKKYVN